MRAKLSAICLGIEEKTFVKKDTGEIKFSTRGNLLELSCNPFSGQIIVMFQRFALWAVV